MHALMIALDSRPRFREGRLFAGMTGAQPHVTHTIRFSEALAPPAWVTRVELGDEMVHRVHL